MSSLLEILKEKKRIVETELQKLIDEKNGCPKILQEAMSYSLMAGGKRIRPILCLMTVELFKPVSTEILRCACSLEFLHTYTLIHDDLPCMDNDDLRRGKPTLHKAFPENIALLAGDALLTESFEIIARNTQNTPERGIKIIVNFAELTGKCGVIGGQVLDLQSENKSITPEELEEIHHNKTAKLIMASVRMGAMLAGTNESEFNHLAEYSKLIDHAFQISDDILDEIGDTAKMGKNSGQDKKLNKATYVKFFGLDKSKAILKEKINLAVTHLIPFGDRAKNLIALAHYIGNREN